MYYDQYDENDQYAPYDQDGYYDRNGGQSYQDQIPDPVCAFLLRLRTALENSNVAELQNLYENTFPELSSFYYKDEPWPDSVQVGELVQGTEVFTTLYRELYYRHLYAKCQPTTTDRCDSYYNYCHLFNQIVSAPTPLALELPHQWMWDIIDEFIYQFQSCSMLRMRNTKGQPQPTAEEIIEAQRVWNVHSVLNVLHSLIDKSCITEQLKESNAGRNPDQVGGIYGNRTLYRMLGYYSLIGLLRLHSLLGDYHQAIKVLENIDLNRQIMRNMPFVRVLACQITTYYYVGFAYMMMKRYSDAIRTFTNLLVYLQRTKQIHQHRTFQVELMDKQTDQMYILLCMCLVLHPQRIDESVTVHMQEKYSEMTLKLQRGDINEFETQFRYACPKFLSPAPIPLDQEAAIEATNASNKAEPLRQQLRVFLEEVTQQLPLLIIRSYLKLYKTMSIQKLAGFLDIEADKLEENLLCFKHKKQNMVCQKESVSALDGQLKSGSDVDFYIDRDMIHIADTKVARRYGDYFMRQVHKFDELYRIVKNIKV